MYIATNIIILTLSIPHSRKPKTD